MIKICREEGSNGCGNGDGRDEGAASQQCKSAVLARIQQTWQHEAAEYDQWRWVKWMWRFWIDVIAWPIVLDGKEWRYEKNSEGGRYRLRFPVISSFGYVDFPPKNVNFPLRRNFHLLISLSRLKKKVHAVSIFRSFPNERYRLNAFWLQRRTRPWTARSLPNWAVEISMKSPSSSDSNRPSMNWGLGRAILIIILDELTIVTANASSIT